MRMMTRSGALALACLALAACEAGRIVEQGIQTFDRTLDATLEVTGDIDCFAREDVRLDRAEDRYVASEGGVLMFDCAYRAGDTLGDGLARLSDQRRAAMNRMLEDSGGAAPPDT